MATKDKEVAEIILEQMGGNHFVVMCGIKDMVYGHNENGDSWLRMKLPRNGSKANLLRITLNGKDLYDMEFLKVSYPKMKKDFTFSDYKETEVAVFEDVYCDQLAEIFEQTTKMYTKL